MILKLRNGRDLPSASASEYEIDGLLLAGVSGFDSMFGLEFTIAFHSREALREAQRKTGWKQCDELVLEVEMIGSYIRTREPRNRYRPTYYGYYSLDDDTSFAYAIGGEASTIRMATARILELVRA